MLTRICLTIIGTGAVVYMACDFVRDELVKKKLMSAWFIGIISFVLAVLVGLCVWDGAPILLPE
jgi:hypothetical protein